MMAIRYTWRQNETSETGPRFRFGIRGPITDNAPVSHMLNRASGSATQLEIEICVRGGGWFSERQVKIGVDSLDVVPVSK